MKTNSFGLVIALVFGLFVQAFGQTRARLEIAGGNELQVYGRSNWCYQVELSTNLIGWETIGDYFLITDNPQVRMTGESGEQKFFRTRALTAANNKSYDDICAEHDNVNVALLGYNVTSFWITATHPTNYIPADYNCYANFNNCPAGTNVDYVYSPVLPGEGVKIYDNGTDYLVVHRDATFWRPQAMTVLLNGETVIVSGTNRSDSIHYIELGRKISGVNQWPKFFVLYADGNMRLIPFPPATQTDVCFGSSVIIGPAPIAERPYSDIASVDYRTATRTLIVTYRLGGTATFDVNALTRTNAIVKVTKNYSSDEPFCTFRSMFIANGNSDCDHVQWLDTNGTTNVSSIMTFDVSAGTEWFFYRQTTSIQRASAPDIQITLH